MLPKFPLVYVIVLAWNGREHTIECIKSLLQSDYPNYRILLVDNASSDDTERTITKEFPDVELVQNASNLGYLKEITLVSNTH